MIEAVVALLLAVLLVLVFSAGWALKLAVVGGVGFGIYVLILVILWAVGRVRSVP